MPGLNGIEVAQAVDADDEAAPVIVFVTAHDQFATAAFDVSAADYLLKPVDRDRFERALERVSARLGATRAFGLDPALRLVLEKLQAQRSYPKRFLVRAVKGYYFVKADDVEWVDAQGNYVRLHAGGRAHMIRATMKSFEQQLDPERFVRVHRSAIVAVDCVERIEPHEHGSTATCAGLGSHRAERTATRSGSVQIAQIAGHDHDQTAGAPWARTGRAGRPIARHHAPALEGFHHRAWEIVTAGWSLAPGGESGAASPIRDSMKLFVVASPRGGLCHRPLHAQTTAALRRDSRHRARLQIEGLDAGDADRMASVHPELGTDVRTNGDQARARSASRSLAMTLVNGTEPAAGRADAKGGQQSDVTILDIARCRAERESGGVRLIDLFICSREVQRSWRIINVLWELAEREGRREAAWAFHIAQRSALSAQREAPSATASRNRRAAPRGSWCA